MCDGGDGTLTLTPHSIPANVTLSPAVAAVVRSGAMEGLAVGPEPG